MINITVIDDEPHCSSRILSLLKPYENKVHVTIHETAVAAVKGIDTLRPDIVFLDVQLQDKTGFDVLKAVSHRTFNLIFTTAYEQYAINAFKYSAIDYLLKPVDKEDFENALQKAFSKIEKEHLTEKINVLFTHHSKENTPKKISLPTAGGYVFLNIADIVRCQSDVNYTHIFVSDNKKHTVAKTLKYYEELLSVSRFFRVHNSHLINLDYVKAYAKSGYVTLLDDTRLEVSHRRKEEFLKALSNY